MGNYLNSGECHPNWTGKAGLARMCRNTPQLADYQYKMLSTGQTSTLEKEWIVATSQAYKAVGVISRTEAMILMEREITK